MELKKIKLGALFKVQHGYAFKSENYVKKSNYRLITLGNFNENNSFKFNDAKATYYGSEFPKEYILKEGDLIMPLTEQVIGLFGNTAIVPKTNNYTFVLNQRVGKIIIEETKADKMFLHYLLATTSVKNQLEARASGTRQRNISPDNIYDVEVSIPPLETQKRIGLILLSLEQQIERNNDMVQKLQVLAQSTYSRWFNQFEFPNEDGLPYKSNGGKLVYNEELKREIPIGWEVKELDSILKESDKSQIQVGEAKQNIGTYPFFTSGEEIVLYKDAFVNGAYCYLNTGGNADVKFFDGKASYSTDTWCISFDEYTYIMKEYLQSIKPLMDKLFFSGSGLKHLQKEAFKKQKVLIPPLNLVLAYNDIVSDCQKQASKIYMQNIELNQLKSKLLPLLINGQLEV